MRIVIFENSYHQEGTLVNGANMAKSGFRKALEKIRKSK